jgi:hypothetical protein
VDSTKDHIRLVLDDLVCEAHTIDITRHPPIIDPDVAAVRPTKSLKLLAQRRGAMKSFCIICARHPNCYLR